MIEQKNLTINHCISLLKMKTDIHLAIAAKFFPLLDAIRTHINKVMVAGGTLQNKAFSVIKHEQAIK